MATFGGTSIFGRSVAVLMVPAPSEAQINTFFGVTGKFRLHGGSRGRTLLVTGVLSDSSPANVDAAMGTILSYDDGIARTLDDGRTAWTNVVFSGVAEFTGPYGVGHDGLWLRPYRAVFEAMI